MKSLMAPAEFLKYLPTEGTPTNLYTGEKYRMKKLERCLCVAGKNVIFYAKSPIRSLLQADLGTIMRETTSPLSGINQMLVSVTGGEGSPPSKNHMKIGPLIKLKCE